MGSKVKVNELKRFPHLAKNLSESEEEEIILESDELELSDEEEERLTDGSPMKENRSNNIPAILPTEIFFVAKIYCTLQNFKKFIAQIVDSLNKENDYEVKFMKRSFKVKNGFILPKIEELVSISYDDVVCVWQCQNQLPTQPDCQGLLSFYETINNVV